LSNREYDREIQINSIPRRIAMIRFAVVLITVLLLAGVATAAIQPGDGLLTFSAGYATGKSALLGSTLEGGTVSFGYEKLDWTKPVSFGVHFGFSENHATCKFTLRQAAS